MTTQASIILFFNVFIVLSFLVLIAIVSLRKNNSISNLLLAFILLIPAVTIFYNIALHYISMQRASFLFYFLPSFTLFFGPAVLAHLHSQQGNKQIFKSWLLFHIIPGTLLMLFSLFFLLFMQLETETLQKKIVNGEDLISNGLNIVILLHIITYLILAKSNVIQYRKEARHQINNYEELNIKWMNYFVNSLTILNMGIIIAYSIQMTLFPSMSFYTDMIVTPLAAFIFYMILVSKSYTFHAIINKQQFMWLIKLNEHHSKQTVPIEKILSNKQLLQFTKIKARLEQLLESDKIYLNNDLNLQQVADMIGCGRTALSQTINTQYQMTFFDLINSYKVEEAKRLLCNSKYQHLKIESIGELAGFHSRTGFFAIFKKITNFSPAEFRHLSHGQ